MAFKTTTTNPGSGGSALATDIFTDTDAVQRTMPFSAIAVGDIGGPYVPVDSTHPFPVTVENVSMAITAAALPLPAGASTAANQATEIAALSAILSALGGTINVSGAFFQATQPVSVASLPLPAGAATQATLAAISGQLPSALGRMAGTDSLSVILSSDQSAVPVSGTLGVKLFDSTGTNVANISAAGAVTVDGSGVIQPVSGTVNTDLHDGAGNALTSILTGSARPLHVAVVDAAGNQITSFGGGGGGSNGAASATGGLVPTDADYQGVNIGGDLVGQTGVVVGSHVAAHTDVASVGGAALALGQATMANSLPVALASNQGAVPVSGTVAISNTGFAVVGSVTVVDSVPLTVGGTVAVSSVSGTVAVTQSGAWAVGLSGAIPAGTNMIGHVIVDSGTVNVGNVTGTVNVAQSGSWTVAISGTTTVSGTVTANQGGAPWSQNQTQVNGVAVSTGEGASDAGTQRVSLGTDSGLSTWSKLSTADTNLNTVKSSAGTLFRIEAFNTGTTVAWLRLYNKASNPAPASDTPVRRYPIPPNYGGLIDAFLKGVPFATGIAYDITGAAADTDTTALAANQVALNLDYK